VREWSQRARGAALALSGVVDIDEERPGILLLADIRQIFAERGVERIGLKILMEDLHSGTFEEHPWQEWSDGRGLKPTGVGRLLRPFGIRARQLWIGGANVRGYDLEQFSDAFARYLPLPQEGTATRYTAMSERKSEHEPSGIAVQTPSGGKKTNGSPTPEWDGIYRHDCALCGQPIEPDAGFLDVPTMSFMHQACRPALRALS
jgi:hypothetical protein